MRFIDRKLVTYIETPEESTLEDFQYALKKLTDSFRAEMLTLHNPIRMEILEQTLSDGSIVNEFRILIAPSEYTDI